MLRRCILGLGFVKCREGSKRGEARVDIAQAACCVLFLGMKLQVEKDTEIDLTEQFHCSVTLVPNACLDVWPLYSHTQYEAQRSLNASHDNNSFSSV